jgi:hypothetical protein
VAGTRCEPKLTGGKEIIRAFPRPSSSETLTDCNDASIGNTVSLFSAGRAFEITFARWLLKSATANALFCLDAG